MKPNASGVAKWSALRRVRSLASGRAATSRSAGSGEVVVADDDQHRDT